MAVVTLDFTILWVWRAFSVDCGRFRASRWNYMYCVEWNNNYDRTEPTFVELVFALGDFAEIQFFYFRFGRIAYILLSFFFSSGDDSINLAGGISKFVTDISVSFSGICIWSGPATFKTTCQMEVDEWPFDQQTCELSFGSYTYGESLLRIRLFADRSDFASKELSLLLLWNRLTL